MFDEILKIANDTSSTKLLTIENFIDGQFKSTKNHIDSYDPSNGQVWAKVPDSGPAEIDEAVQAARRAFVTWSKETIRRRSEILNRIADLIEANLDALAAIE